MKSEPEAAGGPAAVRRFHVVAVQRMDYLAAKWVIGEVAGFETVYTFHTLRHTAITSVYRATKDLFLTQRFARHANPITTIAYTHVSDEEMYAAIRGIRTGSRAQVSLLG